ncbi:uncharacterized protein LOC124813486 isoform X1 [Hydra vulgaris]|uniref:uncharacterized protein LOC124813486 isoform X1 n=1 Tax=Hydra vulgaris TaxID=6087 RepID=UPI0001927232|nr:uncharacterized protein LOC124813486 isoform X1 [Hydra vulgaris]
MSLLATSYRYESEGSRFSHKAFKGQNIKSKRDEKHATGKKCDSQGFMVAEAIKSPEKLEEIIARRKAKRDIEVIKEELKYERKSLILLRRSQLRTLLMEEFISYEKDLIKQGKAFYLERI